MTKLFRVYSVRENYKDRDTVVVDWFCFKREKPAVSYEAIIANYDELNDEERSRACGLVDNYLTEDEVKELRGYIEFGSGFDIKSTEISTPFEDGRKIHDFSKPVDSELEGDYVHLSGKDGYDLSVPISGFYDLSDPPNLVSSMD